MAVNKDEPGDLDVLLELVTSILDRNDVTYVVTGSNASILFGEPRMTNDIDIVVRLGAADVDWFCRAFSDETFYLSHVAVRDAVEQCGMFNVIHIASALKVDFVVADQSEWSRLLIARGSRRVVGDDLQPRFASPEDVIISKLRFFQEGASEKHLRDIAGILRVSGDELDLDYIDLWAARFGVLDIWNTMRDQQA